MREAILNGGRAARVALSVQVRNPVHLEEASISTRRSPRALGTHGTAVQSQLDRLLLGKPLIWTGLRL